MTTFVPTFAPKSRSIQTLILDGTGSECMKMSDRSTTQTISTGSGTPRSNVWLLYLSSLIKFAPAEHNQVSARS